MVTSSTPLAVPSEHADMDDVLRHDAVKLFVDRATTVVAYDFLVCYPTSADNPYPDYALPTGNAVPHMQRGADPPLWPDATTRWPVSRRRPTSALAMSPW